MTTESDRMLHAFSSFRQFFDILTIFTWKNFRNPEKKNQAKATGMAVLFFGLFTACTGAFWHCINLKFDLSKTALPFALLLTTIQVLITYITMAIKYKEIAHVIGILAEKIDKRWFPHT